MSTSKETAADRKEHLVRLRNTLTHCVSARQRRAVREAIRHSMRPEGPTRS